MEDPGIDCRAGALSDQHPRGTGAMGGMNRFCAVAAAAAAWAMAGCGPKVVPGLVVTGDPVGETHASTGFAVTTTFDRAMVAQNLVGQVAAKAPCILRPHVEGEF